jgi:hypothetical protein
MTNMPNEFREKETINAYLRLPYISYNHLISHTQQDANTQEQDLV